MPLDPAFVQDCLYETGGLLIDEILEIDREGQRVRARMPTHDALPITEHQRVVPNLHPRHISGGLIVHMTGVMGFVHFYYVMGLRTGDGWTGYGVRIQNARFHALAEPSEPLILDCVAKRTRRIGDKINVRYAFQFHQADRLVFESEQSAMWLQITPPAGA